MEKCFKQKFYDSICLLDMLQQSKNFSQLDILNNVNNRRYGITFKHYISKSIK